MLNFNFDISKILAGLDGIKQQINEAVRPAAQAGAQVFYNEVKLRATRGDKTRNLKSGKTRPAGLLASSIYEVFSKDNSNQNHATYHVSWNKKKAPH